MTALQRPTGHVRSTSLLATTVAVTAVAVAALVASAQLPRLQPFLAAIFALSIGSGLLASYLLGVHARIARRADWHWLAVGTAATTLTMAVQLSGFPGVAPGGGPLGTTGDGAAWLYVVWHVAVPASVVAAVTGTPLRWCRPFLVLVAGLAVLAASNRWVDVPPLFTAAGTYTGALEATMAVLALLTFATVAAWCRRAGRHALGPDAWFAVSLTLGAFDVALHTFADQRLTALWWASLACRLAQFVVLAGGLTVHISRLQLSLHDYADQTEQASATSLREAVTDHLTQALNRRGLQLALEQEPSGEGGSVVFIDLDAFKAVNDREGHAAGDRILCDAASAVRTAIRSQDLLARWGGDEFVVVLRDDRPDTAAATTDRIRAALASVSPASVGTCRYAAGTSAQVLQAISDADAAMYLDKAVRTGAPARTAVRA